MIMKSNGDDTWQYGSALWGSQDLLNENDPGTNVRLSFLVSANFHKRTWPSNVRARSENDFLQRCL
jgi:hypothetical protein